MVENDLHKPGAKDDSEKPNLDLVLGSFPKALTMVGAVGTFGAKKYTDNGWLDVPDGQRRYASALLRHYFLDADGEFLDEEIQLPHVAMIAWNALAKLELVLIEQEKKHRWLDSFGSVPTKYKVIRYFYKGVAVAEFFIDELCNPSAPDYPHQTGNWEKFDTRYVGEGYVLSTY